MVLCLISVRGSNGERRFLGDVFYLLGMEPIRLSVRFDRDQNMSAYLA